MKRPTVYIQEINSLFRLQMHDGNEFLLLQSKSFETPRECEKFVDVLRVHMRFQTNFTRCKNMAGHYGFEVRTCWDDLIATSVWFANREEREVAMQRTFDANTLAVFVQTSICSVKPYSAIWQGVA